MQPFSLRLLQLPNDYPAIAALLNTMRQEPLTATHLEQEDSRIPTENKTALDADGQLIGFCRERVVAATADGEVIGYASTWRSPLAPPGILASHLVVDPAFQKRGVGQALFDHLVRFAHDQGAQQLVTELPDHLPESRAFAEKRGCQLERHVFQSVLDLQAFEEATFQGVIEALEAQGIRFLTLEQWRAEADEAELYELFSRSALDIPGSPMIPTWEEWQEMTHAYPTDYLYVAAEGRQPVALTQLIQNEQTGGLYNEYTGVASSHRGRGLALALKLLSIRVGRRYGATYMRTDNDSTNHAMLAVNQKLGYQPAPGHYRICKELK